MVKRWTISVPDELADRVDERFGHGDSRSEWVVDAIERKLSEGESANERRVEGQPETRQEPQAGRDVALPDDVPQTVDEEEARQAIQAVLQYLETEGGASQREIVAAVMPDHSLGYDVPELEKGDRYRGSWWRRVVKPGLELDDRVQKPATGESEWRWREDR